MGITKETCLSQVLNANLFDITSCALNQNINPFVIHSSKKHKLGTICTVC